jgi:DegV family protein with EDD domain
MRRVAIITDSSACFPPTVARRLGIRVLPLSVHLGSETVPDGTHNLSSRVYDAMHRDDPVKSSPPSTAEYLTAIEEARATEVVVITPATEFTSMYRNAALAADLASRPTEVVDARTAAAAHGLVVLMAAEAAHAGNQLPRVVAEAEDAATKVDLVACLANLDPLRDSGRVSPTALQTVDRVRSRSVFRLSDGVVEPLATSNGMTRALRRIHREWKTSGGPDARRSIIFHAQQDAAAAALADMIGRPNWVTEFSAAMGIHTGPWVVGVSWISS